ncbi:hypothetical protein PENSPDRAFT_754899 [Peniophora sp. CONT]|nr:hypothetical protein PENSPDRAFT_754899 [Peniophora sp. CONT]
MPEPIIYYDMPRKGPGDWSDGEQSWSANTLKTRYALNIKGLSYKTEWLSFSQIEPKMKALGLGPHPSSIGAKGIASIPYSVPTIIDNGSIVTESFAIAQYLDKVYPHTPVLVAPGTAALQRAYLDTVLQPLVEACFPIICHAIFEQCCMAPADSEHFRRTREEWFGGVKLEDIAPKGEEKVREACETLKKHLDGIAGHVAANGVEGGVLISGGETPNHADTSIGAVLNCIVKIMGKEHELSRVVLEHAWAGRYLQVFLKWE